MGRKPAELTSVPVQFAQELELEFHTYPTFFNLYRIYPAASLAFKSSLDQRNHRWGFTDAIFSIGILYEAPGMNGSTAGISRILNCNFMIVS